MESCIGCSQSYRELPPWSATFEKLGARSIIQVMLEAGQDFLTRYSSIEKTQLLRFFEAIFSLLLFYTKENKRELQINRVLYCDLQIVI